MRRIASSFSLAGWAGFTALGAVRILIEAGLLGPLPAIDAFAQANGASSPLAALAGVPPADVVGFALLLGALALGCGVALVGLNSERPFVVRRTEPFAGAVLTAIFAFYAASTLAGAPVAGLFGSGVGFLVSLALAFGALLFDHLIETDDAEADEEAFQTVLRSIRAAERDAAAERRDGRGYPRREDG